MDWTMDYYKHPGGPKDTPDMSTLPIFCIMCIWPVICVTTGKTYAAFMSQHSALLSFVIYSVDVICYEKRFHLWGEFLQIILPQALCQIPAYISRLRGNHFSCSHVFGLQGWSMWSEAQGSRVKCTVKRCTQEMRVYKMSNHLESI